MKEKKLIPNRRFKEFQNTDAWEQHKLKDVATKIGSGKTPRGGSSVYIQSGIPLLRSQNINNDRVNFKEVVCITKFMDEEMSNSRVMQNDVLLNITGASIGRSAVYDFAGPANVNQHVCIIRPNQGINPYFIQLNITTAKGQKQIDINQAGGAREGLNFQQIGKMNFDYPKYNEQNKIGSFFKHLDEMITIEQRKIDKTKALKSAYLVEMFPAKGERVPKRRFEGFTDGWEETELGELGITQSGIGFPEKEQGGKKGVPFIKVSDMNIRGNEIELIRTNHYVNERQIDEKKWRPIADTPAIIFAKVGAAIFLNKKRLINKPFLIDNNMMSYSFNYSWDIDFGKILFEKLNLSKYAQVGALPSLSASDIENIKVSIPAKKEQQKIGDFFKKLDNTIMNHKRKLDKLKATKQAYLHEMFV